MTRKGFIAITLLALFIVFIVVILSIIIKRTDLDFANKAILNYEYGDDNIHADLNKNEFSRIKKIMDKQFLIPDGGYPSCGFGKNISVTFVGNGKSRTFSIACDTCPTIVDEETGIYFDIYDEERKQINIIFEKYGGKFPSE